MYIKKVKICEKNINDLLSPKNGIHTFCNDPILTEQSQMEKKEHDFFVEFKGNQSYYKYFGKFFPLSFMHNSKSFFCKEAFLTEMSAYDDIKIKCSSLSCGTESSYFRMIIPNITKSNFFLNFPIFSFSSENCSSNLELTRVYINGYETHIFIDKINSKDSLFIDYLGFIDKESFYINCTRILCAMGIISGVFQKEECFLLSSDVQDFSKVSFIEYRYIGKTIYSPNSVFPIDRKELRQKENVFFDRITVESFTKLVNKMIIDLRFENTIFAFMDCLDYPLETQTVCLSTVLEGLCNHVEENNEDKFLAINNKSQAKALRKEMKDLLPKYQPYLNPDGDRILNARIDQINQETNGKRFEKVINILGIKLNEYENQNLLNRNVFLHGNIDPQFEAISFRPTDPDFYKTLCSSLVFIRLLYKMLLRIIDYSGYINNPLFTFSDLFLFPEIEEKIIKV